MTDPLPDPIQQRVEAALKVTIEGELQRASADRAAGVAGFFARGAIFSRSDGFDKGIFFSRYAAGPPDLKEDPELLATFAELPEEGLAAFARRLSGFQEIKQIKATVTEVKAADTEGGTG